MTISERIHDYLVEQRLTGICDDCLQRKLGLARRQEVAPVTTTLGTDPWFPTGIRPLSLLLKAA